MKLKYDFVINDVAGSGVAVPVGTGASDFLGYIKLNETGTYIFKALINGETEKENIVKGLLKDFTDVTPEQAATAVDDFLKELKEANVLEDE